MVVSRPGAAVGVTLSKADTIAVAESILVRAR